MEVLFLVIGLVIEWVPESSPGGCWLVFDICVYNDAREEDAKSDGERFVERPLESVPLVRVAGAPLHGRHAVGQLAVAPPPQRVRRLAAAGTCHTAH